MKNHSDKILLNLSRIFYDLIAYIENFIAYYGNN